MKDYTDIIDSPVITEKSAIKMQNDNVYTFKVAKDADKTQIKKAVEEIFGVQVAKVNTVNYDGKIKRMGRSEGRTPSFKKAYVQLTENSKRIEFFDSLA